MPTRTQAGTHRQRSLPATGFTYVSVLILLAIISLVSTASLQVGSIQQRRSAEEALLVIGAEFSQALTSYAQASPPGQKRSPASLKDLVTDQRFPTPQHHLRKLYADPLTGKEEWGTQMAADGSGVTGVYSLSDATPIKIGNFNPPYENFAGQNSYKLWVFKISPRAQIRSATHH